MINRLKLLFKSLLVPQVNEELYRLRDYAAMSTGVRTRLTFSICLAMTLLLLGFMFALTRSNMDIPTYLDSRADILRIHRDYMEINYAVPRDSTCAEPRSCLEELTRDAVFYRAQPNSNVHFFPEDYAPVVRGSTRKQLIAFDGRWERRPINEMGDNVVLKIPRFFFEKAWLFSGGQPVGTWLSGDMISIPITREQYDKGEISLLLLLDVTYGQDTRVVDGRDPAFVTTHYEFKRFEEFLQHRRVSPTSQFGTVARIVIAIFALLLFLIIESSPEALGLALFMGFEACVLTLTYSDVRRLWIDDSVDLTGLIHYCNAMGDVFRFYFYVQLCRVLPPNPGKWLGYASIYALGYGILRHVQFDFWGSPRWYDHHITQRDMLAATLGIVFCVSTIRHLWGRSLPWRVTALALAGLAALAQWLGAAPFYFPAIQILSERLFNYQVMIAIINANSAYLFALSTFINISTLENRVKVLSREKARAETMQRELELGQSVQRSFLRLPEMPAEIGMACHYEAAVYVSGDTYFVHWNKDSRILTFLLNDVTGHGIQAALKAFACNIIARSVWNRPLTRNDRRSQDVRLKNYDELVEELICREGETNDFNAMVGVEFHLNERLIRLYRVNYNFPVIVEPNFDIGNPEAVLPIQAWNVRCVAVPNQKVQELPLREGAIMLLISDGFIDNPRSLRSFAGYLSRALAREDRTLNVIRLRSHALSWEQSAGARSVDDRTILVFQWNPYNEVQAAPAPDQHRTSA